ncbi:MAG: lycopene cyclase family protein [Bacteroidota bacterium]|nr:lycopene cyclase family protein [Bacteroidota bacterium]
MPGSKLSANRRRQEYDYILLGAGCAGLSLLMRMIRTGKFSGKNILLVDKAPKTTNDRTWCFWETGKGFFEEIVHRQWSSLDFLSDTYSATLNIEPYHYKMIRGIEFYNYCFHEISKHSNIELLYGQAGGMVHHKEGVTLILDDKELEPGRAIIFNSIYHPPPVSKRYIELLQHFKGWMIETNSPSFTADKATLMDFRVPQGHGTAFVYVLPLSATKALVEYTLFTKELLQQEQYDKELKSYIEDLLMIKNYTVSEQESGIIPMTNRKFPFYYDGAYQVGAAGGQTKASSGYTFQFIQKQSQQIVDCLVADKSLDTIPATPGRFRFYDNTLLDILYHKRFPGKKIFTDLFKKNKPRQVLRFLDNESSIADELKIISSLPTWPFLKAAIRQW